MRRLIILVVAACNPYDHDLGRDPFLCGPAEPRCPKEYRCVENSTTGTAICVSASGATADGNGPSCADDSAFEPNDSIAVASTTPLDTMRTFVQDGLAICPWSDRDTFSITIGTADENVEILATFEAGGAVLRGTILNTGGVPIATAAPSGAPNTIRAYAPSLAAGVYYAQITGPAGAEITNNYKLTINVTGP